jgi:transketolase
LTTHIDRPHPIYFRCGRGREALIYDTPPSFEIGGSNQLRDGDDISILAIGNLVKAACDASDHLKKEGIGVRVVDMYSINPIDKDAIRRACSNHRMVVTAEEHNVTGGFGSAVADVIAEEGLGAKLVKIGMPPDAYSVLGPPIHLYAHYGLDGEGVAKRVREARL